MLLAKQGIIPKDEFHDPYISNSNGNTVAMLLAQKGIRPPEKWRHIPTLLNENQETVAMMLAKNNIIPSSFWEHDPRI